MRTVDSWRRVLRLALRDAQRARDADAIAVLRDTLAAIDNAEATDIRAAPAATSVVIAGAVDGLGAAEVERRVLGPHDVEELVEREQRERRDAASRYDALGRTAEAEVLRRQLALIDRLAEQPV